MLLLKDDLCSKRIKKRTTGREGGSKEVKSGTSLEPQEVKQNKFARLSLFVVSSVALA